MKALILILATAVSLQAQSIKEGKRITEWTLIAQDENSRSYFAPSTVRRAGDVIKTWVEVELPRGSSHVMADTDFSVVRAYAILDCAKSKLHFATAILYDRDDKIAVTGERLTDAVAWEKPGSIGHAIFQYFCERPAPPPTVAPRLKPANP